jgi:hypothetical protein
MRLLVDEIERGAAPAHGLVQRAVGRLQFARGMAGTALEAHLHRMDAAMRQHRFALGRLGNDDRFVAPLTPTRSRRKSGKCLEKACNAARIVRFLIGGQQQRHVALGGIGHRHQGSRSPLDIAGAQADRAILGHTQGVWISAPVRRIGHRIQMHVEQHLRLATHGVQGHGTRAVVGDAHVETRQVVAQVVEDAARADFARRIARVITDQRPKVSESVVQ